MQMTMNLVSLIMFALWNNLRMRRPCRLQPREILTKGKVTKSFATCRELSHGMLPLQTSGIEWKFRQSLVGLVEVSLNQTKLGPEGPDLMTSEEIIQEFFSQYPTSSPEDREYIEIIIRKNHIKAKFTQR